MPRFMLALLLATCFALVLAAARFGYWWALEAIYGDPAPSLMVLLKQAALFACGAYVGILAVNA